MHANLLDSDLRRMSGISSHFAEELRDAELSSPFFTVERVGELCNDMHQRSAVDEFRRMESVRIFSLYLASQAIFDSVCEHIALELDPGCRKELSNGGYTVSYQVGKEKIQGVFAAKEIISSKLSIATDDFDWGSLWVEIENWRRRRNKLVHRVVSDGPNLKSLSACECGHVSSFHPFERSNSIELSTEELSQILSVFRKLYYAVSMSEVKVNGDFDCEAMS